MNRRSFLSLLPTLALPVGATAAPKRETLVEYISRTVPLACGGSEAAINEFRIQTNWGRHVFHDTIYFDLKSLKSGEVERNAKKWLKESELVWWVDTDKGPHRISPSTLELIPYQPHLRNIDAACTTASAP